MKFFDLHCDTITKLMDRGLDFRKPDQLHVHRPGLTGSNTVAQVFACFVTGYENPDAVFEKCNHCINGIRALAADHENHLAIATDRHSLQSITDTPGKTAVIISIEGATPLQGQAETLDHFYDRGVRLLTIAWDDNEFCGTVFGNQSGLTPNGERLVERCNQLGVIIDVSHASDKAFYEIDAISKKAFVASHSNARAVCGNDRNLTDDMIKKLADRGSIIGLTFGSGFVCPEYFKHEIETRNIILSGLRDKKFTVKEVHKIHHDRMSHLDDAAMPRLLDHVEHIINVGGEDCLTLGSDFDGVDSLVQGIEGVQSFPFLAKAMSRRKISDLTIEKICFGNAFRFFCDAMD